jgi:hypothetical protein
LISFGFELKVANSEFKSVAQVKLQYIVWASRVRHLKEHTKLNLLVQQKN